MPFALLFLLTTLAGPPPRDAGTPSDAAPSDAAPAPSRTDGGVRGSLDKEIIRRVIRRHVDEVKFCYEEQLAVSPNLQGTVIILNNPPTEKCIADKLLKWEFPKPIGGGVVIVSYPFKLRPVTPEL